MNPLLRITPDKALLHPWITNKQNISPLMSLKNLQENKKKYLTKFAAYQELGLVKNVVKKNTMSFSLFSNTPEKKSLTCNLSKSKKDLDSIGSSSSTTIEEANF